MSGDPRVKLGLTLETGVATDCKKTLQFFPTPPELAALVAIRSHVRGCSVLEPSAGHGALAKACVNEGAMLAKAESWYSAQKIAEEIIERMQASTLGWVHRSDALRKQDLTGTARRRLLPALEMFPEDIGIYFHLACYECALENISQARSHLLDALNLAHSQECSDDWKKQVLGNEDLKPLWGLWDEVEI